MPLLPLLLAALLLLASPISGDYCSVTSSSGSTFSLSTLTSTSNYELKLPLANFPNYAPSLPPSSLDQDGDGFISLLLNICSPVQESSCSQESGICLPNPGDPSLSLSLGDVQPQPKLVDGTLTLEFEPGDICLTFPLLNSSSSSSSSSGQLGDMIIRYTTSIRFLCDEKAGSGTPQFQDYDEEDPCHVVIEWATEAACEDTSAGLPMWARILLIIFLLLLSALFSGLTLGLLSLDLVQLEILIASGTEIEKKHAKKIYPVRKHGNYLLCTLLLGNVVVNSSLSILMADITSGLVGMITSSLGIVLFGEIIPQSFCHKHGLAVGAYTVWVVKFFMLITFPLSFPISKALDLALGQELGTMFTRDALKELVSIQNKAGYFTTDEVKMLAGALDFTNKTVADIMTPLEKVFMIKASDNLDLETIQKIFGSGHSRIPVYGQDVDHIEGLLLVKDLAFLNPEDETPVRTIMEYYGRVVRKVYHDTPLDEMLREFRVGKSHLAIVWKVVESDTGGDPLPKNLGIVTLEDVIEELIQMEIDDENDNDRTKHSRNFALEKLEQEKSVLTPQQKAALMNFLSGELPQFKPSMVKPDSLSKLLEMSPLQEINALEKKDGEEMKKTILYEAGKPADYFCIILQGKVQVTSGSDQFVSELGPFGHMGSKALGEETFVADFSATVKDSCQLLKIKRDAYHAAVKATEIAQHRKHQDSSEMLKDVSEQQLDYEPMEVSDHDRLLS